MRVVGIVTGSQYSGKIRFIKPQGVNGHRRHAPGALSSGTPRDSLAKFRAGPRGQYSLKIRFIEKPGVQD